MLRFGFTEGVRDYGRSLTLDPCAYCGGETETFDHVDPVANGGRDEWENYTGSCRACNSRKGPMSLLFALLAFPLLREREAINRDLKVLTQVWARGSAA